MDGKYPLPDVPLTQQQSVIQGDGKSFSVGAAAILAKEYRDAWVCRAASRYPVYGWEKNMGYLTKAHQTAIAQHGLSPLHRKTYALTPSLLTQETVS
jgi:ribonuclease HII